MSDTDRIDELSVRRPDWIGGVWVILSDGQPWAFPRPRARSDASRVGALAWTVEGRHDPGFGATFEALVAGLPDPTAGDPANVGFFTALAGQLLLRNYDLSPDQAGQLLAAGFTAGGDPDGWARAFGTITDEVIRPAFADVRRARGSLPPAAEGGGAVVGLN